MIFRTATGTNGLKNSLWFAVVLLFLISCRSADTRTSIFGQTVKNPPADTPFVYHTEVHVQGDFGKTERKDLESRLYQQLHDSIGIRTVSKLLFSQLKNPPVFDSVNAGHSMVSMSGLMHSLGYFRDSISYKYRVAEVKGQKRVFLDFFVDPRKLFTIDSVSVALNDTSINSPRQSAALDTLQQLTLDSRATSEVKKGAPFSKPLLSSELDRLANIYRNNGFLRMGRDELRILFDTVGIGLLRPTIDPIEQAQLLEALQRRRDNPVSDIEFRLRAITDSSKLIRYHVGNVIIYPDLTAENIKQPLIAEDYYHDVYIRRHQDLFKFRVLTENIYLKRGQLYDQRIQQRTLNRFNSLAAWRTAAVEAVPRAGTDTVDMVIRLSPARKYAFDFNIEGSQNLGGLFIGSNLVGVNLNLQNRNFAQRAVQANYSVGVATELNSSVTQTTQLSGAFSLIFPRFIPGFRLPRKFRDANPRTSIALNARYINRVDYLDLVGVNLSSGWDFSFPRSSFSIRFPNVEYTAVQKKTILNNLIENNKSYDYIFNDGFVTSTIASYATSRVTNRTTRLLRLGGELSGLIMSGIRNRFLDSTLRPFAKLDAVYTINYKLGGNWVLAGRVLAGVGYTFDNGNRFRRSMPFFKAYYAGGANSMRGWALRKLGPGSSVRSFARDQLPERFGDLQFETNFELRYLYANVGGVFLNGAVFTDIGNIWYLREIPEFPEGNFSADRFLKDLAVDVGTGLRVDFGFIKFRLDYAYKLRDPSPDDPALQYKLFPNFKVFGGTFQLGVDYPF